MGNKFSESVFQPNLPIFMGEPIDSIPDDLFIPPNALELVLESFSGPMDLLLYLIKKENIDILKLDVSEITQQYIDYINLMDALNFELAADYLVMAATLAEIKSRMMLPVMEIEDEEDDPRAALIKRLQEYEKYKKAAEKLAVLPRVDRDFYIGTAQLPKIKQSKQKQFFSVDEIKNLYKEIINRPSYKSDHQIQFEELSTKERIKIILDFLADNPIVSFSKISKKKEGKNGIVVSLLASLELAKDGHIELIQNSSDEIYIKAL